MKDKYNLLELNFGTITDDILACFQVFLKFYNFSEVRFKEDLYTYNGSDTSLRGNFLWRFYHDDTSIYVISHLEEEDEIYAHYYKIFQTDYSDINVENPTLLDRSKMTAKSFELLINFFKNKKYNPEVVEKILEPKDAYSIGWEKTLIVFEEEKSAILKEEYIPNKKLRFLTDISFILEFILFKKIPAANIILAPIMLYYLFKDYRKTNVKYIHVKDTLLIIIDTCFLLLSLISLL